MANPIDRFKREHVAIVAALEQAHGLGIGSTEGRNKLFAAKQLLLSHLEAEDKLLYPLLARESETDDALRRKLAAFASEMDSVSSEALRFFEKYLDGGSGMEFAKDFGRLAALLKQRIGREERILYPEYERIGDRSPAISKSLT